MLLLGPASVMALRAALASLCSDLTGLCLFSAFRFIAISATISTGGLAVDGEDSCGSVIMLSGGECSVAALGRAPARTVTPGAGADAGGARTGGPGGGPVGGPGMFLEIGIAVGGISHSVPPLSDWDDDAGHCARLHITPLGPMYKPCAGTGACTGGVLIADGTGTGGGRDPHWHW